MSNARDYVRDVASWRDDEFGRHFKQFLPHEDSLRG